MQSTILLISILSTLTSSTPLNVIPRQELGSAPGSTPPNTGNANGLPSISPISIQNNAIACQPLSGIPSNFGQLCIAAAQAAESFANNALSTAGPGAVPIPLTAPSSSADGVACAISITQSGSTGMFDTDGQSVTDILNQLAAATQQAEGKACMASIVDSNGDVVATAATSVQVVTVESAGSS